MTFRVVQLYCRTTAVAGAKLHEYEFEYVKIFACVVTTALPWCMDTAVVAKALLVGINWSSRHNRNFLRPVFSFWVDQLWVYRKTQKSKKMFFSFRVGLLFGFVGELSTNLWPFWRGLWRAFQPPLFGEGFTAKCPVACLLTMALYPAE